MNEISYHSKKHHPFKSKEEWRLMDRIEDFIIDRLYEVRE